MSKYDPEYHRKWYLKNRDRLLLIRRKYNKDYFSRPEVIASEKARNSKPERRAARKAYKKTPAGIAYEKKRRNRPSVKTRNDNARLKHLYGITREEYQKMFVDQNEKCLICSRTAECLNVDHNHKTGKVRGLLCGSCNKALGLFADNTELLSNAIKYLKETDVY